MPNRIFGSISLVSHYDDHDFTVPAAGALTTAYNALVSYAGEDATLSAGVVTSGNTVTTSGHRVGNVSLVATYNSAIETVPSYANLLAAYENLETFLAGNETLSIGFHTVSIDFGEEGGGAE